MPANVMRHKPMFDIADINSNYSNMAEFGENWIRTDIRGL